MTRPSTKAKREHLLDIASGRFLTSGFSAVSVDELVAAANQSKTNVYSWFGGKEGLFLAAVEKMLSEMFVPLANNEFAQLPLEDGLRRLAESILTIVLSKKAVALHRLIVSEATSFPVIAHEWIKAGPERTCRYCSEFIIEHQRAGTLKAGDAQRAGTFLHDMLTGEVSRRMLTGVAMAIEEEDREMLITDTIAAFLHGFGM